jgi:hypothetical protein
MLKSNLIYKGKDPSYSRKLLQEADLGDYSSGKNIEDITEEEAPDSEETNSEEVITPEVEEPLIKDLTNEERVASGVLGMPGVSIINKDTKYDPEYFKTATRKNLISDYKDYVTEVTKGTGIHPDTLFTQFIVESGINRDGSQDGLSAGIRKGNNPFNLKQYANSGVDNIYKHLDDEPEASDFIKYGNIKEGIQGYVDFLLRNPGYSKALKSTNPEEQLRLIAERGFATDPKYLNTLLQVYNKDVRQTPKLRKGGLIYRK